MHFKKNGIRKNQVCMIRPQRAFVKLCDLMKDVMSPDEMTVRPAVPVPIQVPIALHKLSSCREYRLIANQFGVHKSTVMKFVYVL